LSSVTKGKSLITLTPGKVVAAVERRQDVAEEDGEDNDAAPDVNVTDDQGQGY
jgi:hypothetical protein